MANDEPDTDRRVSTRRDFLRNSAVAGGVVWAAPTILSLGPSAFAADGSERCYRFRYERSRPAKGVPGDEDYKPAQAARFECEPGSEPDWADCDSILNYTDYACVTIDNTNPPTASIPEGDILVDEETDGSLIIEMPEDCVYRIVEAKAGGGKNLECKEDAAVVDPDSPNIFRVSMTGTTTDVSHVDVVFCCS